MERNTAIRLVSVVRFASDGGQYKRHKQAHRRGIPEPLLHRPRIKRPRVAGAPRLGSGSSLAHFASTTDTLNYLAYPAALTSILWRTRGGRDSRVLGGNSRLQCPEHRLGPWAKKMPKHSRNHGTAWLTPDSHHRSSGRRIWCTAFHPGRGALTGR